MTGATLHIVFSLSAAGGLRQALREVGRDDQVIAPMGCLSFGPINPPNGELRRAWVEDQLGYTGWEDVVNKSSAFWNQAAAAYDRKIAWLSRRSAQEYAGFLELVWRLGDEPLDLVDLTDIMFANAARMESPRSLTSLSV